jgi:hypothetical protein
MYATALCTFIFLIFFANFYIHEYYVRQAKKSKRAAMENSTAAATASASAAAAAKQKAN